MVLNKTTELKKKLIIMFSKLTASEILINTERHEMYTERNNGNEPDEVLISNLETLEDNVRKLRMSDIYITESDEDINIYLALAELKINEVKSLLNLDDDFRKIKVSYVPIDGVKIVKYDTGE